MPATAVAIGVVVARQGVATATGQDGAVRSLEAGAAIYPGDVLRTETDSALVARLANGRQIELEARAEMVLGASVFDPGSVADPSALAAQIEAAQQAILAGRDPTEFLPPPAAGPAAGAGPGTGGPTSEGGHGFVVVELTGARVTPESGFETEGLQFALPPLIDDLLFVPEAGEPAPPTPPMPELPTVAISDGDPAPQIEDGSPFITFHITLSAPTDAPVTVSYATVDGTAQAGLDFVGVPGTPPSTVVFAPGEVLKAITVQTVDDDLIEGTETFTVQLGSASSNGSALPITDGTGLGSIVEPTWWSGTRGDDQRIGAEGPDVMLGRGGNDTLDGQAGNDTLNGGTGNDILVGGAGDDLLIGGSGVDRFVYGIESEPADPTVVAAASGNDVIQDYNLAEGDVLHIVDVLGNVDDLAGLEDLLTLGPAPGGGTLLAFNGTQETLTLAGVQVNDLSQIHIEFSNPVV